MDKLDLAIYNTAHDFPGGVQELAKVIGMNAAVLYNQVNPNTNGHTPNIRKIRAMLLATKDFRILDELEKDCGRVAYRLPDFSKVGDAALLEIFARMMKEIGDLGQRFTEALNDGNFSKEEAVRIRKESNDVLAVVMELAARVDGIAQ